MCKECGCETTTSDQRGPQRCHFAAFDIASGAVRTGPAETALRTYQVELTDGALGVEVARARATATGQIVVVGAWLAGLTAAPRRSKKTSGTD